MKIVFMGSPDFATQTLKALIKSEHDVAAVYSQPPRPSGRGQKLNKTPVHKVADEYNVPIFTPEKLNDIEQLKSVNPDLICVVGYGLILPESVLNIAPCINLHPSALPKWRGAAPMNYPVLNGETDTDICIMQMEKGLDTGPVYLRVPYQIGEDETAGELLERFKGEGAKHMLTVVDNWAEYKDAGIPQIGETTYAHKFKSEDLKQIRTIDFSKKAKEIHNQVRGISPWPGAVFTHDDVEIKVLKSTLSNKSSNGELGSIIDIDEQGIHVCTGEGVVCFTLLQRPGKKPLPAADFLKGYTLNVRDKLS